VAGVTTNQRGERTRRAILDAALRLSAETSLSALSLRHVAREVGIVPTGFYRHFASAEELGLVLVDESFASLRQMLRDVRRANPTLEGVIHRSVGVLVDHVVADPAHIRFVSRERVGGVPAVREAIAHQLELFEAEIATDFARLPGAAAWSTEDLRISANLIVTAMVAAAERILHASSAAARAEIAGVTEKQLRMLAIGAQNWRSRG
jgi:AcrR family transcriptional regulator